MIKYTSLFCLFAFLLFSCKEDLPEPSDGDPKPGLTTDRMLKIKFQFDPNQERLNNIGAVAEIPAGHGVQTPNFHALGAHFIELVPDKWTPYKGGVQVYQGAEVADNGSNPFGFTTAIDFDKAIHVGDDEYFFEIPISELKAGTYKHIRVSVAYQNYTIAYNLKNIPVVGDLDQQSGTVASFVGYNTHINDLVVNEMKTTVNDSKLQGYWAFETDFEPPYTNYNQVFTGEVPANATTVVNPFPESPIPPGSCVVSGSLDQDLEITGTETEDLILTLSFSINGSFEWQDKNGNGAWDLDAQNQANSEPVVDMGLRGLQGFVGE